MRTSVDALRQVRARALRIANNDDRGYDERVATSLRDLADVVEENRDTDERLDAWQTVVGFVHNRAGHDFRSSNEGEQQ